MQGKWKKLKKKGVWVSAHSVLAYAEFTACSWFSRVPEKYRNEADLRVIKFLIEQKDESLDDAVKTLDRKKPWGLPVRNQP